MWKKQKVVMAGRPKGSERTHIAARGGRVLAAGAPGSWGLGTGLGKDRDWGDPAKGPKGGKVGRVGGGGEGEGKGVKKREGAKGQVAVAAQAHLGKHCKGARGIAEAHLRGVEE